MVGFTIIYIHHEGYIRPLKVSVTKNLERDGKLIVSLRTLHRIGTIPDKWPKIDTS